MIERYTPPEARMIWKKQTKFSFWLQVELAVLWARMKLGEISQECYKAIRKHAGFRLKRIAELEEEYNHDMIAFVECVRERLRTKGVPAVWADEFHKKLTSYDIEDPALMLMLLKMGKLILEALEALEAAMLKKAKEHQWTIMAARTHGQIAEPTTFGHYLLVFVDEIRRAKERIKWAMEHDLAVGKMSGAVGTYAGMNPKIEELACQYLGLKSVPIATQILQRDRHANFVASLTIISAVIEQIAHTFWVLMRSEVLELQEPRRKKQRGSSAMPQKKNPIVTERLIGLARVMRGYLQVAMENIATFESREISQSGPERIILPDATTLALYMIKTMTGIIEGLVVFPDRMKENLEASFGTWAGQRIRYALVKAGVPDSVAYEVVQKASFSAINGRMSLAEVLANTPISDEDQRKVTELLPNLPELLDPLSYIRDGITTIFERFFPESNKQS